MKEIQKIDPEIFNFCVKEHERQLENIELIASENYVSPAVLEAQGSILTNKYAEGLPQKRYYGGCQWVDEIEQLCIQRAQQLFNCEHVNVQPHSGSQANMSVYLSCLEKGDTILGLDLSHGGHLTHGHPMNFSGKNYHVIKFHINKDTELIDYDEVEQLALKHHPKLICIGASAYSRQINWERFRIICDKVNAVMMADIAHYAGLIVANVYPSPVPYADFVTTTTHKTLRGPRGGMVMCKKQYAKTLDKIVFPGIQGGPLMHVIAGKAVALKEANTEAFRNYQKCVIQNAQILSQSLETLGCRIVSGGTDSHMFLIDVKKHNVTGKIVEQALDQVCITVNKNTIPYDTYSPFITSGIRIGTPSVTTRGMKENEMKQIAQWIKSVIDHHEDAEKMQKIRENVKQLTKNYSLFTY